LCLFYTKKENLSIEIVKDKRRKRAKRYSEDEKIYKERNRIMSVFGNVKRGEVDIQHKNSFNLAF
jgi:hypothetical protein